MVKVVKAELKTEYDKFLDCDYEYVDFYLDDKPIDKICISLIPYEYRTRHILKIFNVIDRAVQQDVCEFGTRYAIDNDNFIDFMKWMLYPKNVFYLVFSKNRI